MPELSLRINNLKKFYRHGHSPALENFSFTSEKCKFITIFGPNGSGKTTLLRCLAGLESYEGAIEVLGSPPKKGRFGIVFQDYSASLFPWMDVMQNLLFPLIHGKKMSPETANKHIEHFLGNLSFNNIPLDKFPAQLSGGQQQMVCILRTLAFESDVLLLDEPFSSLDHEYRIYMHSFIQKIWDTQKPLILMVSHFLSEAIYLGDELILMSKSPGRVKKVFKIDFERPRKPELMVSAEFKKLEKEILGELQNNSYEDKISI